MKNYTVFLLLTFFSAPSGAQQLGEARWDKYFAGDSSIVREKRPMDHQLYPRKKNNKATVIFSGTLVGYKSIQLIAIKTDFKGYRSICHEARVGVINGRFSHTIEITAELSEYSFYYKPGNNIHAKLIADHVVCGDAYLISGQSNAFGSDLSKQEQDSLNINFGNGAWPLAGSVYGKYSRSFGCELPLRNTDKWGISRHDYDGCRHVGPWGLILQHLIAKSYGIPTCIINGAMWSSAITRNHLPANGEYFFNPALNDIPAASIPMRNLFARMNTRVYGAGLQDDIRGIFWMQGDGGDYNEETGYTAEFEKLQKLWNTYYPDFGRIYMIQVHSWLDKIEMKMRNLSEAQRTAPRNFARTSVMSANGIGHHKMEREHEVHFQYLGHVELAKRLFRLLEKDVYGKTQDVNDINPPDIIGATRKGNRISLFFNQRLHPGNSDNLDSVLSVIKFNTGYGNKSNPVICGNEFSFSVSDTFVSTISYAGFLPKAFVQEPFHCNPDFGCYLRNSKNVAALSFHNFPITVYDHEFSATFYMLLILRSGIQLLPALLMIICSCYV